MEPYKLNIGLFGFGVVGEGIYKVLQDTPSLNATIKKVCIKNLAKIRNAPMSLFTNSSRALLEDPEINLIVELIDDAEAAFEIVSNAMKNKKHVVSANKKMIAGHLPTLISMQKEYNVSFLYEAAVCGSIPVIRNLEEYYDNDLLKSICGIVNGSTNFILTKMLDEKLPYKAALYEAQQKGFAESNPDLDVLGKDAVNKLVILLMHAHGILTSPFSILHRGITQIHPADAIVAVERGYKIKLVARTVQAEKNKIIAYVMPQFVTADSKLSGVNEENNGLVLESKLADKQFLYGKGAGRFPTASAVLSDIAALRYIYKYEYRKFAAKERYNIQHSFHLRVYVSFADWNQINKWEFEWIEEEHEDVDRKYIVGVIHSKKLSEAEWFKNDEVSIIVMPASIVPQDEIVKRSLRTLSLKLAGVGG